MINLTNHSRGLRCVGQELRDRDIEVFELKTFAGGYRVSAGDPHPPYTRLIELTFTSQDIELMDRAGQAMRGRSSGEVRFDTPAEMLRALGEYIDRRQLELRRIDNSASSGNADLPTWTLEYQNRAGEIQSEDLPMSFLRQTSVRMYKRRANVSNPIEMLTRKR